MPMALLLTAQDLFSVDKNLLLRICNSLLHRLSRSCHTALVGSIKMFLAAAFPINDPSAVNFTRKHNLANVVPYESKDGFAAALGAQQLEVETETEGEVVAT